MQSIWGRRTETGHTNDEFRDEMQLHLARSLGEPHVAFNDQDGGPANPGSRVRPWT